MKGKRAQWLLLAAICAIYGVGKAEADEEEFGADALKPQELSTTISSLDGEPSAFAGYGVNVISGSYNEGGVDISVRGSASTSIARCYCSGRSSRGSFHDAWNLTHCDVIRDPYGGGEGELPETCLYEGTGAHFLFSGYDPGKLAPITLKHGLTNTGSGAISAKTNMKNLQLLRPNRLHRVVIDGSGMLRVFHRTKDSSKDLFRLTLRKNPSGTFLTYSYHNHDHDFLHHIRAHSRSGKEIGWIQIDHPWGYFKEQPRAVAYSSDGTHVEYLFKRRGKHFLLRNVIPSHAIATHYRYGKNNKLFKKEGPDMRFVETRYYKEGHNDVGGEDVRLGAEEEAIMGRVMLQRAPVGTTSAPVITHRFFYHFPHENREKSSAGYASVFDALGFCSRYHWDDRERLVAIEYCDKNKRTQLLEKIFWGRKKYSGNMVSRALCTPKGQAMVARALSYDERGNIVADKLFGQLTGFCATAIRMDGKGQIEENGCDCHTTFYSYDGSIRNLLVKQNDLRKTISYKYLPNSDLLIAALTEDSGGAILLRHFYSYDDNATLIEEIVDNGLAIARSDLTGVTQRIIRRITPQSCYPIGLPWVVEEFFLDTASGQELFLSRVINSYSREGRLLHQEHQGSDGASAYLLHWEYDERGNVTKSIDALGQQTLRRFDANNNLIWEQGSRPDAHKEYAYDFSNRLISESEVHVSGARLTKNFSYDYLGRCIASSDVYGNTTEYAYGLMGRKTHEVHPIVREADGLPVSTAHLTQYDLLGNPTVQSNARTFATHTTYNVRGQPTDVTNPDGTQELFRYYIDGCLQLHRAADGTSTNLTYDYQKRPLVKESRDSTGALLRRIEYNYDAFHLLEERDNSGHLTSYHYDGAGRLIEQQRDGQKTTFSYDALGRVHMTCSFFGGDPLQFIATIQRHDLLGRTVEERTEDACGNVQNRVLHSYDAAGNRTATTTFGAAGVATSYVDYTPSGEPWRWIDAEGHTSWKAIHYGFINALGQRVRYEELTDSLGLISCCEYDALGRLVTKSMRALFGGIVAKSELFYDCDGNLARQVDSSFNPVDGALLSVHTTRRDYDSMNRMVALHEGVYTAAMRTTHIVYNTIGQKQAVLYPDGVALHFQYDAAGRLMRRFSSDATIDDFFSYDSCGNVIESIDKINGWVARRSYNALGHITREHLGNGLVMHYVSDLMGRPMSVEMPDGSVIVYRYSGAQLIHIDRFTAGGSHYIHTYDSSDLSGKVTKATLIGKAGEAKWEYDKLGRMTRITSSCWHEATAAIDGVGNLWEKFTVDPIWGGFRTAYGYDSLHQLNNEHGGSATQAYIFDSLHNRRECNGAIATYSVCHELLNDGSASYVYDSRGNLIKEERAGITTSYTYDALNRMTSMSCGSHRTSYIYDSFHRRLAKYQSEWDAGHWHATICQRMAFHGENEVGVYDTLGRAIAIRVLGISLRGGAEIAAAVAIELQDKAYAPIHDLHGNVTCLLDSAQGSVAATYRYSAYGEKQENILDPLCATNPWQWMSKSHDEESGFIFFGRRYYNPTAMRWTTPDPLGHASGPNLYAYVHNRPLYLIDLYGLIAEDILQESRQEENWFYSTLKDSVQAAGRFIYGFGKHAVGVPLLSDVICFAGHTLAGNDPNDYVMSYREPHSSNFHVGEFDAPDKRIIIVNGILCTRDEVHKRAEELSAMLGGERIYVTYNATHGCAMDFLETLGQKLGITTRSVDKLARQALACLDAVGPQGEVWIYAHSQGAEISWGLTRKLSDGDLKRLTVRTVGGARIIPDNVFKDAVNFVSENDGVPRIADPIGYHLGLSKQRNLVMLKSNSSPLIDHAMNGDTYSEVTGKVLNDYSRLRS